MTNEASAQQEQVPESGHGSRVATGFAVFAGVIMIMTGFCQGFIGLVGLISNDYYVGTRNYVFEFNATTWGWTHLLIGILVLVAGAGVVIGKTWARAVGITLAALSALATFAFAPYSPFWSLTIIALDVVVIWALAVYHQPKS